MDDNNDNEPPLRRSSRTRAPPKHVYEPPVRRRRVKSFTATPSVSNDVVLAKQSQSWCCVAGPNSESTTPMTPESSAPGRRKPRSRTVAPKKQEQPNAPDSPTVELVVQGPPLSPFVLPQHDRNAELAAPTGPMIPEVSTPGGRKPRSRTVAPNRYPQIDAPESPLVQPADSDTPMPSSDVAVASAVLHSPVLPVASQTVQCVQLNDSAAMKSPPARIVRPPRSRTVAKPAEQPPPSVGSVVPVDSSTVPTPPVDPTIAVVPISTLPVPNGQVAEQVVSAVPIAPSDAPAIAALPVHEPPDQRRRVNSFTATPSVPSDVILPVQSQSWCGTAESNTTTAEPTSSMTPDDSAPGRRKPRSRTVAPKKQQRANAPDSPMIQPDDLGASVAAPSVPTPSSNATVKAPPKGRGRKQLTFAPEAPTVIPTVQGHPLSPFVLPQHDLTAEPTAPAASMTPEGSTPGGRKPRSRTVAPKKQIPDSAAVNSAIEGAPTSPIIVPQCVTASELPAPAVPTTPGGRKPRSRTIAPKKQMNVTDRPIVQPAVVGTPMFPMASPPVPMSSPTVKAPPKPRGRKRQQAIHPDSAVVSFDTEGAPTSSMIVPQCVTTSEVPAPVTPGGRKPRSRTVAPKKQTTVPDSSMNHSGDPTPSVASTAATVKPPPKPRRRKQQQPAAPDSSLIQSGDLPAPMSIPVIMPVRRGRQPQARTTFINPPPAVDRSTGVVDIPSVSAAIPPVDPTVAVAPPTNPAPCRRKRAPKEPAVPGAAPPARKRRKVAPANSPPVNLTLPPPSAHDGVPQPIGAANVPEAAVPLVNLTLQPPNVHEVVPQFAEAANQPAVVHEAALPLSNIVHQPAVVPEVAHPPVNLTLQPPNHPRAAPPPTNFAVQQAASSSSSSANVPSSSNAPTSSQNQPAPVHVAVPPPFNFSQFPRLPESASYITRAYPANMQHLLTPPPAQPHNPHMDHCEGEVNYIGSFIANGMLAYFAHDAVHYSGNQLHGHSGTDACFGAVTFLQNDAEPAGMNAYREAFERARREKVQYAYIEGTELKFKIPKEKPPWVEVYKADIKVAETIMMNLFHNSQTLIHEANQALAAQGISLF
uniref:BRCT domain-containing protein n=1 Tax=Panagrellus redivivus TaxID=6233 RepID=A0A7E4ZR18_PANRE